MKKQLLRPENLLLLLPLLFFCFSGPFSGTTAIDVHFHDTYIVIDCAIVFVPVFTALCMLYVFHVVLRLNLQWGGVFCKAHIYLSVMLFIAITGLSIPGDSFNGLAGAPRRYYDASPGNVFLFYSRKQVAVFMLLFTFLLLQLIFLFFFIIKLFKKTAQD